MNLSDLQDLIGHGHDPRLVIRVVGQWVPVDAAVVATYDGELAVRLEAVDVTAAAETEVEQEVADLVDMWSSSPDSYAFITSRFPGLSHAIESLRTAWERRDGSSSPLPGGEEK